MTQACNKGEVGGYTWLFACITAEWADPNGRALMNILAWVATCRSAQWLFKVENYGFTQARTSANGRYPMCTALGSHPCTRKCGNGHQAVCKCLFKVGRYKNDVHVQYRRLPALHRFSHIIHSKSHFSRSLCSMWDERPTGPFSPAHFRGVLCKRGGIHKNRDVRGIGVAKSPSNERRACVILFVPRAHWGVRGGVGLLV